ncbi:Asp23/Gls24 family envelope stress response protein, partial [Streptococcus mitis]|nr:Asp23/Gls24 family envelope stress response protein [Streptococcus mitis]
MGIKSFEKRSKYPLIQYSAFTLGLKYDKIEYQL